MLQPLEEAKLPKFSFLGGTKGFNLKNIFEEVKGVLEIFDGLTGKAFGKDELKDFDIEIFHKKDKCEFGDDGKLKLKFDPFFDHTLKIHHPKYQGIFHKFKGSLLGPLFLYPIVKDLLKPPSRLVLTWDEKCKLDLDLHLKYGIKDGIKDGLKHIFHSDRGDPLSVFLENDRDKNQDGRETILIKDMPFEFKGPAIAYVH